MPAQARAELGQVAGQVRRLTKGRANDVVAGPWHSRCLTIGCGTTEVQKNVVAEHIRGLPRDDAR